MDRLKRLLRRFDGYQQRHAWLAVPIAVVRKFGDDQAGNQAALLAYYGFFSLFPLLLVFVTVVSFILAGHAALQERLLRSAVANFPVLGNDLASSAHKIRGSGLTLAIGLVLTLWSGLGIGQVAQNAMNTVWNVPRKDWPPFAKRLLRSLGMLGVLGLGILATTGLAGLGTAHAAGGVVRALSLLASFLVNLVLFYLAFRVLTVADVGWKHVQAGTILAAVVWTALQTLGTYYVSNQVAHAGATYGTFAIVIGLLVWIYLGAQITLYGAEINVVKREHLWPRSLVQPPLAEADKRTYEHTARVEERRPEEEVTVTFDRAAVEGSTSDSVVTPAEPAKHDHDTAVAKQRREAS
jgi:YihY family inner membrane protein